MKSKENCTFCHNQVDVPYYPMKEWKIEGLLCGNCYSKKIREFYPGDHARVNTSN